MCAQPIDGGVEHFVSFAETEAYQVIDIIRSIKSADRNRRDTSFESQIATEIDVGIFVPEGSEVHVHKIGGMTGQYVEANGGQAPLQQITLGLQVPAELSVPVLLMLESESNGAL